MDPSQPSVSAKAFLAAALTIGVSAGLRVHFLNTDSPLASKAVEVVDGPYRSLTRHTPSKAGSRISLNNDLSPTSEISAGSTAIPGTLDAVSADVAPLVTAVPPIKTLHDRIRGNGRDENWATPAEKALRGEYETILRETGVEQRAKVNCGTTICEVQASYGNDDRANQRMMTRIQSPALAARLWSRGYHNVGAAYGPSKSGVETSLTYYQREAPSTVKYRRD